VQVDPIKPKSKQPGTKRLKPKRDIMLSKSAFEFNLRHYTEAQEVKQQHLERWKQQKRDQYAEWKHGKEAGAYTRPLFSST